MSTELATDFRALENRTLAKYRVVKLIGKGSMGSVYLGHDPFIDRPVAIKVADEPSPLAVGEEGIARRIFLNEAQTAGMLKHPNIAAIFDAGTDGDLFYIVMEYVHGGRTLDYYCSPEHLLPVREALAIVYKCAVALDYAHRKNIVHRDVKPRNILVTSEHDIKLTDFGIAVNQNDPRGSAVQHAGSPLYMAPEQIRQEPSTPQTDLFALGVVMYELLTGVHPFHGENIEAINHKILTGKVAPILSLRAELPAIVQRIIARALAKEPRQRYRTGLDLAGDLSLAFDFLGTERPAPNQQSKFDLVRGLSFFNQFTDAELWEIINASTWDEVAPGSTIIAEGEIDKSFYIIVSGSVEVRKTSQYIDTLNAGDCFGEMGFISGHERSATIIAREPVTVMKVMAPLVERASVNAQLRFYKLFLHALVERLSRATDRIVHSSESSRN